MHDRLTFPQFLRQYLPYLMPSVFLIYLVLETYQIDFRPYYVAGKLIPMGLDPYLNYVTQFPELFSPVNAKDTAGSGFIYPPFAALLFVPFGFLPYITAKTIYSVLMLGCLWWFLFRLVRQQKFVVSGGAIALVMASFPILGNFERGQIDIFVCCLTVIAFYHYQTTQRSTLAAFLLGLACHIKIFPVVALLYFLAKRQFQLVVKTIGVILLLTLGPVSFFGTKIYTSYLQRMFPNLFGQLFPAGPIDVHGQGVVNRVVQAIDGRGLRVTHDFVNGYMNPLLNKTPFFAILVGLIALFILIRLLRKQPIEHQFFSALNAIHLCNPQTWIMGIVWYIPFFIYFFDRAKAWGKVILMLPLFLPPFLNASGMVAYAIPLAFAFPRVRDRLLEMPDASE
jgi:hypothetical protein